MRILAVISVLIVNIKISSQWMIDIYTSLNSYGRTAGIAIAFEGLFHKIRCNAANTLMKCKLKHVNNLLASDINKEGQIFIK